MTQDDAGLWTDGRYFLQAEAQLQGTGIRLFRMGEPGVPTVEEYIQEHLEKGEKLGFDGRIMGASRALAFAKAAEENGASLSTEEDLIGEIWADRPEVPDADLFVLEEKWSGETTDKKLARVRKAMEEKEADLHVHGIFVRYCMAPQHPRRGHSLRSGCIILPDRDEERMYLVCASVRHYRENQKLCGRLWYCHQRI